MSAGRGHPEGHAGRPRRMEPPDGQGEPPRLPNPRAPAPHILWTPALVLHLATASVTRRSASDRWAPYTASRTVGTCVCSSTTRPAGPSTRGLSARCTGGRAEPLCSLPYPLQRAGLALKEEGRAWWGPEGTRSKERGPWCEARGWGPWGAVGSWGSRSGANICSEGQRGLCSLTGRRWGIGVLS